MQTRQQLINFIKSEINSHQVVIFSKSYCPYCAESKKLLQMTLHLPDVQVHELDEHPQGHEMQQILFSMTKQRTVPSVFVRGVHVGGNDKLHHALYDGHLEELLEKERTTENQPTDKRGRFIVTPAAPSA